MEFEFTFTVLFEDDDIPDIDDIVYAKSYGHALQKIAARLPDAEDEILVVSVRKRNTK